MEFLGHVCRRRGLEFLSLTGKVEGKRDRGKQRITFLDSLERHGRQCLLQIWHLMMMMGLTYSNSSLKSLDCRQVSGTVTSIDPTFLILFSLIN